jgi:hypothetical protein
MSEYFKPWRRKLGWIILVIAVVILRVSCGRLGVRYPIAAIEIVSILIAGVAMSAAIMIADSRDLALVRLATVRAIVGAFVGIVMLSDSILTAQYGYDHGYGETEKSVLIGGVIGTALNCLFWSLAREFQKNSETCPPPQI